MRNTAESGRSLLGVLTDDELARYGEIARDQAGLELNRWWVQAALAAGAVASFGWAAVKWDAAGFDPSGLGRSVVVALGLAAVLAYGPYRRVKNWTLWNSHCKAVSAEQARRKGGHAGPQGFGGG